MKKSKKQAFTLIECVGQALPDKAPAKGHLAFTLIELLVVVLIIGILAAIAPVGINSKVLTIPL